MKRTNVEEVINAITEAYQKGITKIQNYIVKSSRRTLSESENSEFDGRTVEAIAFTERSEAVGKLRNETFNLVIGIINNYQQEEKAFFTLSGDDLTKDNQILNEEFKPSKNDIDNLCEKYRDCNYTQYKAVENYAKKHGISLNVIQSSNERMEKIDYFNKMMKPRFLQDTQLPQNNVKLESHSFNDSLDFYKNNALRDIK